MNIYRRETVGEIVVITLEVQSIDSNNAQKITRRVSGEIAGRNRIIVDLGELRYFDVGGFAAILQWAGGGPQKAQVLFCTQSGTIRALFELLRANTVIPLFRTREEAIASFRNQERRAEVRVMARSVTAGATN